MVAATARESKPGRRAARPASEVGQPAPAQVGSNPVWQRLAAGFGPLQPKLRVGAVGDPLEREADRVADAVVSGSAAGTVQRKCATCEEEEKLQTKREAGPGGSTPEVSPTTASRIASFRGGGEALSPAARSYFEPRFGRDLSTVRLHTGGEAAMAAQEVQARAFTVGSDIAFAAGEYRPESSEGRRLLAHELTHTLQQGDEPQSLQTALRLGSAADPAEGEADRVADAVIRGGNPGTVRRQAPALRRQRRDCTVNRGTEDNQLLVNCRPDRFHVTFSVSHTREPEPRVTGRPGIDFSNVFFDLEFCRGNTRVRVRPSINLTGALRDMLGNIVSGSPVLQDITANPDLEIEIVISETFRGTIGGGPFIDPQSGRTTGAGMRVEIPWERAPRVDCRRERFFLHLRCERLTTRPAQPARPAVTHDERRHVFMLFPYEQSTPVTEMRMGIEDATPMVLADPELSLQELAAQGFRVTRIEGFTSPEGPRPRGGRQRFQGNDQLGQERADSAQTWLTEHCPGCGAETVAPTGRSELFSPPTTPETEGEALTQLVTPQFLAADPLRPATEEERAALAQSSTRQQKAEIFPLLRRADVALERTVEDQPAQPAVPEREDSEGVACPEVVRQAVRNFLGIS